MFDLEDINSEFAQADIAFVIDANDVTVNPAAEDDKSSPIYGMRSTMWKDQRMMFVERSLTFRYASIDGARCSSQQHHDALGDARMTEGIVEAI